MGFCIEPIEADKVLILRAGPKLEAFGDEFDFSTTITITNGVAEVKGASGVMMTVGETKAVIKELKEKWGVSKVVWERIGKGRNKVVEHG